MTRDACVFIQYCYIYSLSPFKRLWGKSERLRRGNKSTANGTLQQPTCSIIWPHHNQAGEKWKRKIGITDRTRKPVSGRMWTRHVDQEETWWRGSAPERTSSDQDAGWTQLPNKLCHRNSFNTTVKCCCYWIQTEIYIQLNRCFFPPKSNVSMLLIQWHVNGAFSSGYTSSQATHQSYSSTSWKWTCWEKGRLSWTRDGVWRPYTRR